MSEDFRERAVERIRDTDYFGDATIITPCNRLGCEGVVLMAPKVGGFNDTTESFKKGSAECPECGKEHVPATLTMYYPGGTYE